MLKVYITAILSISYFLCLGQVDIVWEEERDSVSLDNKIAKSISSKVLDNETINRFWRQHSIKNGFNPEINLGMKFLSLKFYLNDNDQVKTVGYNLTSRKYDGESVTLITFPKQTVVSTMDSLDLNNRILSFTNFLNSNDFSFRSKFYELGLGRIREPLNTTGIKKWEKLKQTTRPDTVTRLSFSGFKLKNVPEDLERFVNVEELDFSGNYLVKIPKSIFKLKKLEILNLSNNALDESSIHFAKNKSLKIVNLQKNNFRTLPKKLKKLKTLDFLISGRNSLDRLGAYKFQKLKRLKNLNLYNASLSSIPPKLFKLNGLEELDLYYNFIKVIDGDVRQWPLLKTLAVSYNGLWKLPDELYELKSLKTLYAHHNKLEKIPSLPMSLEVLDIGYNEFKEFPFAINSLRNLKELDYNGNELNRPIRGDYIPENLKILFITANPLFNIEELKSDSEAFILDLQKKNIEVR